jgi:hypothetical protein
MIFATFIFTVVQKILVRLVTFQVLISNSGYELSIAILIVNAGAKLEIVEDIEILAFFRLPYKAINQHEHQDAQDNSTQKCVILVLRLR